MISETLKYIFRKPITYWILFVALLVISTLIIPKDMSYIPIAGIVLLLIYLPGVIEDSYLL